MATDTVPIAEHGIATLPEQAWERARHRAEIIGPLAQSETVGHEAVDAAAQALGLSRRQVYVLIRRARQGSGLVTDLALGQSSGGKGKGRLPESVERINRELLQKRFLTKQKRSLAAFHREVARACKLQKLRVPARKTVALRIASLDSLKATRLREGQDVSRTLQGVGGVPPPISAPLEQVQIDHTVIDLIVVDERDRQPIGRPYLTLAIAVFTCCVVGMVVTLEAPSAVSVGLCLAHAGCDKRPWLEGLDVEMNWPMSGKPALLYLDNAAEFKSEVLRRGCEQHGIRLDYRSLGQPHYGGIVERIIGTAMQMIHDELPGTTFSNPDQRGEYASEKMAALTLRELERWLALAVGTYHGSVHNDLLQPPVARWAEAIARAGVPTIITRTTAFLIDFLPIIRRTLTRTGFVIDYIHYYADALKPWIARRDRLPAFLIRRDPRDISRIWVLEPEGQHYLEIPYRTLSHPAVTLWEQRQALAKLRQQGREQVDESVLFRMIGQMREIVTTAQKATRKARRDADRRQHLKASAPPVPRKAKPCLRGSTAWPFAITWRCPSCWSTILVTARSMTWTAPPLALLTMLSQRSGIELGRLRCMSFASWVPWLLDSLDDQIPDGLETYAFQLSVLLPKLRRRTRSITSWRAWLPSQPIHRACPLCLNDPANQAVLLGWKLPLMLSCPMHGCWAESVAPV